MRVLAQHHTAYVGYSVHRAEAATHPFFSSRSSSSSGSLSGASPRAGGPPGESPRGRSGGCPQGAPHGTGASPRASGAPAANAPDPNPEGQALNLAACPPPASQVGLNNGGSGGGGGNGGTGAAKMPSPLSMEQAGAGEADEEVRLFTCTPNATIREVRQPLMRCAALSLQLLVKSTTL